jgi:hypothetical protein
MKPCLLDKSQDFGFDATLPPGHQDLIQDLELSTLLRAMAAGDDYLLDVCRKVLLAGLHEPGAIRFRQQVLADCLAHPAPVRAAYDVAAAALRDKRRLWSGYGGSYQNPASNLSGAVGHLESFATRLRQLRQIADDHAGKFRSAGLTTLFATLRRELDDEYFGQISEHLKQLRFGHGVLISAELDPDNSSSRLVLRDPGTIQRGWKERLGLGPRNRYSFSLEARDETGSQILEDLTSRGVNLVANAAAQSADHIGSYFTMLRAELGFYVGCLNLAGQLTECGIPVAFPDPEPLAPPGPPRFSCTDLRDVSLALQAPGPVIGNDVPGDGKPLVIITGANSGGKSTFLRSAGQAQLMMQCGLFVTAQSYRASIARAVFTHFIRDEDAEMTSGRLDEELRRMSTIADRIQPGSLLLFNESFAGTNEREGAEIGRQIVSALLEAGIRVLFVTHRFGLAEHFRDHRTDETLFLRAEREPGGRRSYKLAVTEPLPTSYGEDLYYQHGRWLGETALSLAAGDEVDQGTL